MKLLYEAQLDARELKKKYINHLKKGAFTLGYALQFGFNSLDLQLSNSTIVEVGWLHTDKNRRKIYDGTCTDYQLATVVDLLDAYEDDNGYTNIIVTCHNKENEKRFMEGEDE